MYVIDFEEESDIVVCNGGKVDIKTIEVYAVEVYVETPRFITFVHHVQKDDDSEFFCIRIFTVIDPHSKKKVSVWEKRRYTVPKQELVMLCDPNYGQLVCAEVRGQENFPGQYWLISHCTSRTGFVIEKDRFSPPRR